MRGAERAPAAELPVACTLGRDDGMARLQRWKLLSLKGRPSTQREGRRLVVRYETGPGVREELEALAAAERQCCSFAAWGVMQETDYVVLHVEANDEGLAALAELFRAQ